MRGCFFKNKNSKETMEKKKKKENLQTKKERMHNLFEETKLFF